MLQCFQYFNFPNDGSGQSLRSDRETNFFQGHDAFGGSALCFVDLSVGSFANLFEAFIVRYGACEGCALLEPGAVGMLGGRIVFGVGLRLARMGTIEWRWRSAGSCRMGRRATSVVRIVR